MIDLIVFDGVAFGSGSDDGRRLHHDLQHNEDARTFAVAQRYNCLLVGSDEDLRKADRHDYVDVKYKQHDHEQ